MVLNYKGIWYNIKYIEQTTSSLLIRYFPQVVFGV